jgi:hypothetical protein
MLAAFAAALSLSCPPLPGIEQIWADPKIRTVIFGEIHGTSEAPALFADAVCHAAQHGPVTVALEQPDTVRGEIEAYVRTGSRESRAALLATSDWRMGRDGRTSEAMLGLLDRLHALLQTGADLNVVTALPAAMNPAQNYHEIQMAGAWAEATGRPPRLLLGLVGNLHARKIETPSMPGPVLRPAASHLPASETLTVNIVGGGGASWGCRSITDCGPQQYPARTAPPRGIVLTPSADGAYDGAASTGGPWTASPPAAR